MNVKINAQPGPAVHELPVLAIDLPVLYEDDGQEEMGDNALHTETIYAIYTALLAHFGGRENVHVFANLNLHYHPLERAAYVSPDVMVVEAELPAGSERKRGSYRVGEDGPAPLLVIEVLSERTYQQQDISPAGKPFIYGELGIPEYILVDASGEFLPQRMLLKRLVPGARGEKERPLWQDVRDEDGGVTSALGFRLRVEDERVQVIDGDSGRVYLRPDKAQLELFAAEARIAELEARLADLEEKSK